MHSCPRLVPVAVPLAGLVAVLAACLALGGCGGESAPPKESASGGSDGGASVDLDPSKILADVKVPDEVAQGIEVAKEVGTRSVEEAQAGAEKLVERIEQVASAIGVDVTEENRELLEQVAVKVQDDATKEQVRAVAAKLGIDVEDLSIGTLAKSFGMGDDEGDTEDAENAGPDAATRAKRRAKRARKASLGGKAAQEDLAGLDVTALRKGRKAAVTRLESQHGEALAELTTDFEARKKARPADVEKLDRRLARKTKQLREEYDERIQEVRQHYKKAIDATQ